MLKIILFFVISMACFGQSQSMVRVVTSAPSGSCSTTNQIAVLSGTAELYLCSAGTWAKLTACALSGGNTVCTGTVESAGNGAGGIKLKDLDASNFYLFTVPDVISADRTIKWPSGDPGADQVIKWNLSGSTVTGTYGDAGGTPPTAASGFGYWFLGNFGADYTGTEAIPTSGQKLYNINVAVGFTLTKLRTVIAVTTSGTAYFGLYNSDCTTRLSSGSVSTGSSGSVAVTMSSYAITPGNYWVGFSASNSGASLAATSPGSNGGAILNDNIHMVGATSNSGGSAPSACGSLSSGSSNYPLYKLGAN